MSLCPGCLQKTSIKHCNKQRAITLPIFIGLLPKSDMTCSLSTQTRYEIIPINFEKILCKTEKCMGAQMERGTTKCPPHNPSNGKGIKIDSK